MKDISKILVFFAVINSFFISKSFCQYRDSTVDMASRVSCYVQTYNGNKRLWNATGFFFSTKTKLYFITNNHVVGDRFFIDEYRQIQKRDPAPDLIPDKLSIRVYGKALNDTINFDLPIRVNNKPIYLTFKNSATQNDLMDIVAIPVSQNEVSSDKIDIIYLSQQNVEPGLLLVPSTELFIVGFPFDFARYNVYPLWKKATIASEPTLVNSNKFYIDATARGGMSGSPVYFRGSTYTTNHIQHMGVGLTTFLIGVYSAQNIGAEIGVVWKLSKVIDELIKSDQ
jgi:hypothetical protein